MKLTLAGLLCLFVIEEDANAQLLRRRFRERYQAEVLQIYERNQLQRWDWELQAMAHGYQLNLGTFGGGYVGRRNYRMAGALQAQLTRPEYDKAAMDLRLARVERRRLAVDRTIQALQAAGAIAGAATP